METVNKRLLEFWEGYFTDVFDFSSKQRVWQAMMKGI